MSPAAPAIEWTITADVQSFAEAQGVVAYLPTILEITERVFVGTRRKAAVLEVDPDITDVRTIVIEVEACMSVEDGLSAHRRWHEAALQYCPTTLICNFCLRLELVE